jgi:hypothetical protein
VCWRVDGLGGGLGIGVLADFASFAFGVEKERESMKSISPSFNFFERIV